MVVTVTLLSLVDELAGEGQLVNAVVVDGGVVCQPSILCECMKEDQSLPLPSWSDDFVLLRGYR
jgi:hypothetical protein